MQHCWPVLAALVAVVGILASSTTRKRPSPTSILTAAGKQSRQGPGLMTGELHEMRECDNTSSILVLSNWTQTHGPRGEVSVDGMLHFLRPLQFASKGMVTFIKCSEYGTRCEKFMTWRLGPDTCKYWDAKNMFWSPIRNRIRLAEPPHTVAGCPLHKGYVTIRNATLDFGALANACPFPLPTSVWEVMVEAWDEKVDPYFCMFFRAKLIRFKSRDEVGHQA